MSTATRVVVVFVAWWLLACSGGFSVPEPPPPVAPATLVAPAEAADLSAVLGPIRERFGLPGLAAAVVRHGEVIAIGATGTRRQGVDDPVTVDDRWHIGSDTKAMTATLLARLVAAGRLSWEDRVGDRLAAWSPHPGWKDVTLADLVHHVGGVPPNPTPWRMIRLQLTDRSPREARAELAAEVLAEAPTAPPGSAFVYSNLGYVLAGCIAEQVEDAAWEDLIQREVFGPLQMPDVGFGAPGAGSPYGHRGDDLQPVEPGFASDNPTAFGPAGTVHLTLTSWSRFVAAHLRGFDGEDDGYLPPEQWAFLHAPAQEGYAAGWGVTKADWAGGTVLSHAGSNTMWYAVAWLAPARDGAVLFVANAAPDAAQEAADATVAELGPAWLGADADTDPP